MTSPVGQTSQKKAGSGGIRGTVKGFSYASRRRMRHFLMTHDMPDRLLFNVTFTFPTTDINDDQEKLIFENWSRQAVKSDWSAVWRLQVQKRGARHWHLLIGVRPEGIGTPAVQRLRPDLSAKLLWQLGAMHIRDSWAEACNSIGEVGIKVTSRRYGAAAMGRGLISAATGFNKHAVDVQGDYAAGREDREEKSGQVGGAWCRYLCDHATRTSQEAVGKGRQWGIVGRKGFVQVYPDEVYKLDVHQYARFRRAYERLATASRIALDSVFGTKLGRRVKRGRRGTAASFVKPETVRRLIGWAAAASGQEAQPSTPIPSPLKTSAPS